MIHTHESWFYKDAGSDKQYDITIEEKDGTYTASGRWGPRGQLGKPLVWYSGPDLALAEKAAEKERAKRRKKLYTKDESGVPIVGTGDEGEYSGIKPMLLDSIDRKDAQQYIDDDAYWLQEKFDGHRRLAEIKPDGVRGINRRGLYVGLPSDLADELASLPGNDHVIDCEIVKGRLFVFDLIRHNGVELTNMPFRERLDLLTQLVEGNVLATRVSVARTARTREEKQAFYDELVAMEREGGVFKKHGSGLALGTRSKNYLKCKLWETATCQVESLNELRSVRLQMFDGGVPVSLGDCGIPDNYEVPEIGKFVEIEYLYAYRGGAFCQAKYCGERDDVTAADCDIEQLKYKSERTAA